jgi:hypothetical protein
MGSVRRAMNVGRRGTGYDEGLKEAAIEAQ